METREITYISTNEAMRLSGYTQEYLRSLLRQGKLSGKRFGSVWQVEIKSLEEHMKTQGREIKEG